MPELHSPSTISVMIVDDHAMFREALSLALEEYDNLVVPFVAGSGEEAVELLASVNPDIVLMDISLPGMNGLDAIRKAVAIRPLQVIALSMHDRGAYEPAALEAGACAYVFKASPVAELVRLIEQFAHRRPVL